MSSRCFPNYGPESVPNWPNLHTSRHKSPTWSALALPQLWPWYADAVIQPCEDLQRGTFRGTLLVQAQTHQDTDSCNYTMRVERKNEDPFADPICRIHLDRNDQTSECHGKCCAFHPVSASQHLFRKREQATFLAQHHEMQQKHQLIRAMQAVAWKYLAPCTAGFRHSAPLHPQISRP